MLRFILIIFTIITLQANANAKEKALHQQAIGKQRIALTIRYFDDDTLTILIPKSEWVRFLYKATGINTKKRSSYGELTASIYNDGVYDLNQLQPDKKYGQQNIRKLKVSLNRYLTTPISHEMLGYTSFDDFKVHNIKCSDLESKTKFECKLKADSFINIQHVAYIMATNGYLVNAQGYLDFSNVSFVSRY